jgi:2-oxoglutarate ferredoxin oxidoreductase subunit beta
MVSIKDYESDYANQWCPGCGNFGILKAMQEALVQLKILPHQILVVSGIGQAAKTPHFLKCNCFHSLHGRALPLATGAKVANHELTIIVNTGDGDCYAEGGNHLLHAIRRNIDLTVLVHNNSVYGLTRGQASPTAQIGMVTKMQQKGVINTPLKPILLALSLGAGFVARGFSGDSQHLSELIRAGIQHKGFSIIDILQPCVSFNPKDIYQWYKQHVNPLDDSQHDPGDYEKALMMATRDESKIPIGIFFQKEKPNFTDQIAALSDGPLVSKKFNPDRLESVFGRR